MKSYAEREDDIRIMKLFRGRCIVCMQPAQVVHELVTRGRTKNAITMKNNRVALCFYHHTGEGGAHFNGYTDDKSTYLRNQAIARLIMLSVNLEDW
jgi:predicted DCC family thiol-disulfide oxidoreductase YuxK